MATTKILAKALDNSRKCHHIFQYLYPHSQLGCVGLAWEQHYSCADTYKDHTKIPEYGGGSNKYGHFTSITFAITLCCMQ